MRQEGAREGSQTPQKDQSSNKEEGSSDKDHQVTAESGLCFRTEVLARIKFTFCQDFMIPRVMESGPITKICQYCHQKF